MRNLHSLAIGLATTAFCLSAQAADLPAGLAFVKTAEGCQIADLTANIEAFGKDPAATQRTWNGACVDGKASGMGEYRSATKVGEGEWQMTMVLTLRQRFHEGIGFGYGNLTNESKSKTRNSQSHSWFYSMHGKYFTFASGLQDGEQALLDAPVGVLPKVNLDTPAMSMAIMSSSGMIMSATGPCAVFKQQLPECSGPQAASIQVPHIVRMPVSAQGVPDFAAGTRHLCPTREPSSCAPIFKSMGMPILQGGLNLIRTSAPEEERLRGLMAGAAQASSSKKSQQAAASKEVAEKATASFQSRLKTDTVGQLFSLGDELNTKGDKLNARTVYRTLLSRFPDHALALPASKALVDLQ